MYQNKFVTAVKVEGKVLRESGDAVFLPFGSEYSVLLKNLNPVRVLVAVSIDGTDATGEGKLVLQPDSEIELERFIRDGNLSSGNRFKFIERTKAIEAHRGVKSDDGVVRVEYWTEKVAPPVQALPVQYFYYPAPSYPYHHWAYPYYYGDVWCSSSGGQTNGGSTPFTQSAQAQGSSLMATNCASTLSPLRSNGAGITVPGSESLQKFVDASSFSTFPQSEVIVMYLRGEVGETPVKRPVTVSAKPKCSTCGKKNKPTNRFCAACGTALTLI